MKKKIQLTSDTNVSLIHLLSNYNIKSLSRFDSYLADLAYCISSRLNPLAPSEIPTCFLYSVYGISYSFCLLTSVNE